MKILASEIQPEAHYVHLGESRMRVDEVGIFPVFDTNLIEVVVGNGRFVGIFEPDELVEVELA